MGTMGRRAMRSLRDAAKNFPPASVSLNDPVAPTAAATGYRTCRSLHGSRVAHHNSPTDRDLQAFGNPSHPPARRQCRPPAGPRRAAHPDTARPPLPAERALGPGGVSTDPVDLMAANRDWLGQYPGQARVLLRPGSTAEVQAVLRHCNERRIAVVPQGGNTGLTGGGQATSPDEVVLSLARMDRVRSVDPVAGAVDCEAGCVLEVLDRAVAEHGLMVPIDLGAKGSCMIGGNVATNAGGLRFLRYGSVAANLLGLEVVRADGTLLDLMATVRKDAAGYPLRNLFVGSEGTLGVITRVALACPPRPASQHVALLAASDWAAVQRTLVRARRELGEVLSAFEFMDRASVDTASRHLPGYADPFDGSPEAAGAPFYVLLEVSGSHERHDLEKLEGFLAGALEGGEGGVVDGIVSQDAGQVARLWKVRERVPEALPLAGQVYKYDVSVPLDGMYSLVERAREAVGARGTVTGFGHVGDGNLHLNVVVGEKSAELGAALDALVFGEVQAAGGSISAEHGMGQQKRESLGRSKTPEAIAVMAGLKAMLDPRNILNPHKTLPEAALREAFGQ